MDEPKKKAREIKAETLKELAQKIEGAKTIAFTQYHGLTVNQLTQLRKKIKSAGGELLVTKNTLMRRALSVNNLPFTPGELTGPTATVFAYEDEIAPVKIVAETAKILTVPTFKFGFFAGQFLDTLSLEKLASILPKDQLQTKVVGALCAPLYGLVGALQANIRNLINILDQIAKKGAS